MVFVKGERVTVVEVVVRKPDLFPGFTLGYNEMAARIAHTAGLRM